jgi:broad specificity phosphatase PhoE
VRLLLVRHGQTPSNIDKVIDTLVPGPELTALGQSQAASLPGALRGERIDAIYASTQTRAQQTAAPLAADRNLSVVVRDGLREVSAGIYEGRGDKEALHDFVSTEFAWVRGDLERRMPGGESGAETFARFDAVVGEAESAGFAAVVIVSHGSMIRSWAGARSDNVDVAYVRSHPLHNTGVVVLEGSFPDGWSVVTWLDEAIGGHGLDDEGSAGPQVDAAGAA